MGGFSSFGEIRYQAFEIVAELPGNTYLTIVEEHELLATARVMALMIAHPQLKWKIEHKRNQADIGPQKILITASRP